jgi:putative sterol carrier protein
MAVATAQEIFDTVIPKRLTDKPDIATKINASYKFNVTGDGGGTWVVDLTQPGGKITQGDGPAKCTITIAAKDLIEVVNGKLNPQMAFMSGKLKVAGDMGLALKLGSLLG